MGLHMLIIILYWVAMDLLRATHWPSTIHMGLPIYFFVRQNWNILVNASFRAFAVNRVILSAQLGATMPFDVQVTLPACFRVIDWVISFDQLGANLPFDVQLILPALWVNKLATPCG